LEIVPSTLEFEEFPAKLTLFAPVVRAAVVVSTVWDVSFTTALAVEPSAFIVIVLVSVRASAVSDTAIVADPSIPIVAVPETAPPTMSADSTPVRE
jgi:hypothetical protein